MQMTRRKFDNLQRCARPSGVIAALAIDQRGSLRKMLAGAEGREVSDEQMSEFKAVVSETLTPYASAVLLDPEFGTEAAGRRSGA